MKTQHRDAANIPPHYWWLIQTKRQWERHWDQYYIKFVTLQQEWDGYHIQIPVHVISSAGKLQKWLVLVPVPFPVELKFQREEISIIYKEPLFKVPVKFLVPLKLCLNNTPRYPNISKTGKSVKMRGPTYTDNLVIKPLSYKCDDIKWNDEPQNS